MPALKYKRNKLYGQGYKHVGMGMKACRGLLCNRRTEMETALTKREGKEPVGQEDRFSRQGGN
jgi:hypothetical protein